MHNLGHCPLQTVRNAIKVVSMLFITRRASSKSYDGRQILVLLQLSSLLAACDPYLVARTQTSLTFPVTVRVTHCHLHHRGPKPR
jgi:hypothetical protein